VLRDSCSHALRRIGTAQRFRRVARGVSVRAHHATVRVTREPFCRNSNPEDRRVVPEDVNGRKKFKVVYVVLESQYQASMTVACKRINAAQVCSHRHCAGSTYAESQGACAAYTFALADPAPGRRVGVGLGRDGGCILTFRILLRRMCALNPWGTSWRSSATPRLLLTSRRCSRPHRTLVVRFMCAYGTLVNGAHATSPELRAA
jgi:hypothetical protein